MPAPWTAGAQARIIGEMHGSQVVNVLHFATNDQILDQTGLDTILQTLCQGISDAVIAAGLPAFSSDYRFVSVDAKRIAPTLSDPQTVIQPANQVGTAGVSSTSFIAGLMGLRTGGGGRTGRGRIFLPPPGEAEITASELSPGALTAYIDFALALKAKFWGAAANSPWRLGVLSRKVMANTPANFDQAFREVVSADPVGTLAVMRSRRKGHGA